MGRRFKSYRYEPDFPQRLGERSLQRIRDGEKWLAVWQSQRALSDARLAKTSKLPVERIDILARDLDAPTPDELTALALGLGTTVELIEQSLALVPSSAADNVS